MDKRQKSVNKLICCGWIDFEHWYDVTFVFKEGVFKAVTSSGEVRELKKSEKESISIKLKRPTCHRN